MGWNGVRFLTIVHLALQLLLYWVLAFVTLCASVFLLNVFDSLIGEDLILRSAGKEAALAGFASLIEGAGLWAVVEFVPAATRALIVPIIIVALIYKLAHLEDWTRYDVFMLIFFQAVICFVGASLYFGNVQAAFVALFVFAVGLVIVTILLRGL